MDTKLQLKDFLRHRLNCPRRQDTFHIYFWSAVVLVGGGGLWAEIFRPIFSGTLSWNLAQLASALYTFFPAVAVTSAFDLVLDDKQLRSVRAFGVGTIIAVVFWLALCVFHPMPMISVLLGLIGAFCSLVLWRIANGENQQLLDEPPPPKDTSVGGSAEKAPVGNEGDYKLA